MPLRFTADQVNRYVLYKQHLTTPARGHEVLTVLQHIGPLRATPTLALYLSLWCRIEDFRREQLEAALYEQRSLVRMRCMHGRLYALPTEDAPAYFQVTKAVLLQGLQDLDELFPGDGQIGEGAAPFSGLGLVQRVLEVMSTRGPCTIEELYRLLPALNTRLPYDPEHPELGYTRLGARLIPAMCAQGLLIHAQTRGNWRSDLYGYATLSSWLPGLSLDHLPPDEALRQVVLAYVTSFGPVTVGDIVHWLGSVSRREIATAVMQLGDRLLRVQIAGLIGDYLMRDTQVSELLSYAPEGRDICLLPQRDSLTMAYSDTSRFLAPPYHDRVFDRADESLGTVWADGRIVGTWWLQVREERIVVRFFEAVDPEAMALVGEEAYRLGRFLDFQRLDIQMGPYPEEPDEEARRDVEAILDRLSPRVKGNQVVPSSAPPGSR